MTMVELILFIFAVEGALLYIGHHKQVNDFIRRFLEIDD